MKNFTKGVGEIVVAVLLAVSFAFSWGLITYKFINWFLRPVFELPTITYINAVGISVFISLFHNIPQVFKDDLYKGDKTDRRIALFILPFIVLGVGYLIKNLIY